MKILENYWKISKLSASYRRQVLSGIVQAGSLEQLLSSGEGELHREWIAKAKFDKPWDEVLEECSKCNCKVISLEHPDYPEALRQITDPPALLFTRGKELGEYHEKLLISVVGSRSADLQSCQHAYDFSYYLALKNACVVSGLALGVDAAAHEGALASNLDLSTIAVCANGLDRLYPPRNRELGARILDQGGTLISEFAPGIDPLPHHFLQRNRIIAGLSRGVLVVHAGEKSGSLVTARYAMEEGRDVYVTPGGLEQTGYKGSLYLIKCGANLVTSPGDILESLGFDSQSVGSPEKDNQLSKSEKIIIDALRAAGSLHVGALSSSCEEIISELPTLLLELELKGVIKRLPANLYALASKHA